MAKQKREELGLVEQLREAIRGYGKSLNQLSKDSGVATPQLSRFMRGERTLTLPMAEKLCDVLGLQLSPKKGKRKK
jgi:transcriptional regulator with XRE-family HTH domain